MVAQQQQSTSLRIISPRRLSFLLDGNPCLGHGRLSVATPAFLSLSLSLDRSPVDVPTATAVVSPHEHVERHGARVAGADFEILHLGGLPVEEVAAKRAAAVLAAGSRRVTGGRRGFLRGGGSRHAAAAAAAAADAGAEARSAVTVMRLV